MNRKRRSGCGGRTALLLLCVVLIGAIVWGAVKAIDRLTHYGENAIIKVEGNTNDHEQWESMPSNPTTEYALPRNTFHKVGFYEENGIRRYEAAGVTGIPGIDVSSYQPEVDWQQVKEAGIEFAMIRLGYRGYSTGALALDERFLSHMDGALEAGLEVGVYFFSQALTPEEAAEEAEYVITWLEGYDITYPVVFDWEEVDVPARTDEMNMLYLTACAETFCTAVEAAGYEGSVYFNQAYGYEQLNLVSLREYDFWLAEYAPTPTFAYDVDMWQYTNEGTVPGIEGPVDMNIYFKK